MPSTDCAPALKTRVPSRSDLSGRAANIFSFKVLLGCLVLAFLSLFLPRQVEDPDIWWHLQNCAVQLHLKDFLHRDIYSFSVPGSAWINHEWLAEVPFYAGWQIAGDRGLIVVTLVLLSLIFIGTFLSACMQSSNMRAAFLSSLVSVFLATVSFSPRTLLCGWLCLVLELLLFNHLLVANEERTWKLVRLLPVLFFFWVNLHGSWLIGMVLLLVFVGSGFFPCTAGAIDNPVWSRSQKRALIRGTLSSAAALFINPYGYRLVLYPFDLAYRQRLNIASVEEWRSLDFHSPRGRCLMFVLACFLVSLLFRSRKRALYEVSFVAIGTYAAFTYSRFLFLAAILVLPILAKDLALWIPLKRSGERPLLNAVVLAALLSLTGAWQRAPRPPATTSFPIQALPYLRAFHPHGKVFNDYLWGGYLIWNTPDIPVFIDSRVDIYERGGVFADYLHATGLMDTLAILDKYRIDYVLFRRDAPIVYLLEHTAGWKTDYQDPVAILLERVPAVAR